MKQKTEIAAIYILGLIYFIFGLNGFLNFIPPPSDPMPEAATSFFGGIMAAGYFLPVLKGTEVLGGLLLLAGFWRPVALVVLAPITIHILLFHGLLTPGIQFIILPVVMVVLHILSAAKYWDKFKVLFIKG